jgi:limonene-1,2-epoxide hydrolase
MTTSPQGSSNGAAAATTHPEPADVVRDFLTALADDDVDTAVDLVDDDIVYENVSLPTIRGKRRVEQGARAMSRRKIGFDVRIHRIAADGTTVLTERTDAIIIRGYRTQFWVCGVFEVHDGKITLWRDYFDWQAVTIASVRGLLGTVLPTLRARFTS